jgi:hypothetical protein
MPNRREFITGLAATPLAATPLAARLSAFRALAAPRVEIWPEDHCLSRESTAGFQRALAGTTVREMEGALRTQEPTLIILPSVKWLALEPAADLRARMAAGTSVILESGLSFATPAETRHQAEIYSSVFGLRLLPQQRTADHRRQLYIEYDQPARWLVRTFESVLPVCCPSADELARFGEEVVCARKKIGSGTLIYLGSMLGPGLLAQEREAREVAFALVASIQ